MRLDKKPTYEYDAKGNLISSTSFSQRLKTTMRYDLKNRLREETKSGDDNILHTTSFNYDLRDRLTEEIDPFQNSTRYTHDPVSGKILKTDFPIEGISISSTYDSFDREITQTDENGNTTHYSYNAYGSPTSITYPDGAQEIFRYAKNGQLISHTNPEGLTIQYTRDVLGRILTKSYCFAGETLARETFTYSSFQLLSQTDKEGHITAYSYDGAGRKIKEERSGRITEYSYDALGRLCCISEHNGENSLITQYQRDLLDRITEESKTDRSGNLLYQIAYTYDADGNQKSITRFIDNERAVEQFAYDSLGRIVKQIDPHLNTTQILYDEQHRNALGQRVLQKTTIDPCQVVTRETEDALHRLVKKEILSQDILLSCQEKIWDPAGNLSLQKDHLYKNGVFHTTQHTQHSYTENNQLASTTRAFGTLLARTTKYSYTPSGKIASKTLPDETTLTYHYEPLGSFSLL